MKFLVDAHLPPSLCTVLSDAGHEALHTSALPAQNRTTDRVINELSLREQRVVVTKDVDFYHSHLLRGEPWKLLLVRTGNIRTRELAQLVRQHLTAIEAALEGNSLVELDRQEVRVVG
jgi:predicted nuclease of predicted toxin-antitoxin system